ncbi:hypothetical protein MKW94_028951 [Papaver nudicaule]|uniref:Uncharacterized protein n=1 Tax=Papaver nudicaule TaxID=74823 RepID=A0AA41SB01_PAPNU|nr:hypothetical protein [Papaver nudicaule]
MMRHWDDECEDEILSVSKYYLADEEEPVCYSVLPIQWRENQKLVAVDREIILHGYTSSGCQKVYKPVKAWKFDLASFDQVKVEVLSKDNQWIVLDKPITSYEETIRTIRVTLCCLQYLKRNPDASGSSLSSNIFPSLNRGTQFLENDLRDHMAVIKSAVEHDETLASSKFLHAFLESPRKAFSEHNDWGESTGEKTNTEIDDSVCAICDNGGHVLCCDGGCRRCFHATVADAGADAKCESLGLSKAEVALGSSDCSSAQEVFRCSSCGHFYHPKCVADLRNPVNEIESKELQKYIAAGGSFTCPIHYCSRCKKEEDSLVHGLQFAVCRRCPKAYHPLKKLEGGPNFEESKDVIKPKILNQITQWKVVDKLRPYVLDGNMIVNASYTANDFTCLMKQRLEEAGINCSFKDFDVYQSKNGSTTEKCDWLRAEQLPTATKLIIVLNIPFGIKSALADKCIDKALGFRPKLLVLFVPVDIKRLDRSEYQLVWEDSERLLSKFSHSFVSISNDEMKLWNSKPPLLQFWSRVDWFAKHKKIVERMPMNQNDSSVESEEEGNREQEHHYGKFVISNPTNQNHDDKLSSMSPSIHAAPGENDLKIDNGKFKSSKSRMPNTESFGLLDFAPGPYIPFSHDKHSCCGWIDDDE